MSNLIKFAQDELDRIAEGCKNDKEEYDMQQVINKDIMDIIKTFSKQGHTGMTAGYTISMLSRLLNYKPITPLTGEEDEWEDVSDIYNDGIKHYQNKRCPAVFKDEDGKCYNVEAKVFSDDNGHTWYTSGDSREYITFPYTVPNTPQSVIIDNQAERTKVQQEIKQLIESITGVEITKEFTEDSYLKDFLDINLYEQLQTKIIEKYNIKKCLFDITKQCEDTQIWELINIVFNSDKKEQNIND